MQIDSKNRNGELYIFLYGEIDQSKSAEVKARLNSLLTARPLKKVIFNMSGLQFVDSTFIGVLLARYKQLRERGVPIYIEQPSRQIDKVLGVSGIYTIIPKVG
ncbi:MAG: anti-sigma factor antagonist [Christensenellales bacterium]|jgi:stage II sporulation protein AA (anti-sigma F factor antagonist)